MVALTYAEWMIRNKLVSVQMKALAGSSRITAFTGEKMAKMALDDPAFQEALYTIDNKDLQLTPMRLRNIYHNVLDSDTPEAIVLRSIAIGNLQGVCFFVEATQESWMEMGVHESTVETKVKQWTTTSQVYNVVSNKWGKQNNLEDVNIPKHTHQYIHKNFTSSSVYSSFIPPLIPLETFLIHLHSLLPTFSPSIILSPYLLFVLESFTY
jgi:hypothetical protein